MLVGFVLALSVAWVASYKCSLAMLNERCASSKDEEDEGWRGEATRASKRSRSKAANVASCCVALLHAAACVWSAARVARVHRLNMGGGDACDASGAFDARDHEMFRPLMMGAAALSATFFCFDGAMILAVRCGWKGKFPTGRQLQFLAHHAACVTMVAANEARGGIYVEYAPILLWCEVSTVFLNAAHIAKAHWPEAKALLTAAFAATFVASRCVMLPIAVARFYVRDGPSLVMNAMAALTALQMYWGAIIALHTLATFSLTPEGLRTKKTH